MKYFALLAALGILLLAGWVCLPFLPAFVWALIIYQVGQPLQKRLLLRFSSTQTAVLMLSIVTLTLVIPVSLIGTRLVIEATHAYQQLETVQISPASIQRFVAELPLPDVLRSRLESYNLDATLSSHGTEIGKTILRLATGLLTSAAKGAGAFLFSLIAFLFIYFCMCTDGPAWHRKITRAIPAPYGLEALLTRLAAGASGLFWGVAGTCLAQGTAGGLIFLALGLPSPLLVGTLISFCALIPFVGSALVWLPFSIWLLFAGSWGKALILALCGIFIIGSMDNITRPFFTRLSGAEIPVLSVTLGAIGGLAIFGLTGLVVGPLAIEAFSWLLDRLGAEHEETAAETPE